MEGNRESVALPQLGLRFELQRVGFNVEAGAMYELILLQEFNQLRVQYLLDLPVEDRPFELNPKPSHSFFLINVYLHQS